MWIACAAGGLLQGCAPRTPATTRGEPPLKRWTKQSLGCNGNLRKFSTIRKRIIGLESTEHTYVQARRMHRTFKTTKTSPTENFSKIYSMCT